MKRTYALFALGGVLSGVESKFLRWANDKRDVDWRPAQATVAIDQLLHGMSPKPTNAARAFNAEPDRGVERRAKSDNTCAYISGITASSLYCSEDSACVYNTRASAIGCCADVSLNNTSSLPGTSIACPVWTTCLDMTESAKYTTDNGFTMYCGDSTYPVCIKHIYKDPMWTGYTLWGCAKSARTDFVYYTPTELTITTPTTTTEDPFTDPTPDPTDPTPIDTTTPTTSPDPVPPKKSTPTGAIVGGVVGGVGALALIGLAAFFLLRKKKKSNSAAAAAAGPGGDPTSPGQGPPPTGPPAAGYYDPNQPQMAQQQQQGGAYGYGAAGGFAPVDPRASIAKPPYAVQQSEYNPNQNPSPNPNQFSPPGSPAPAYNGEPGGGVYGQQPYQAGQYNNPGGYPSPPPQAQPYGHQQPGGGHPTHFAAELPTQRGDGEVRELAG